MVASVTIDTMCFSAEVDLAAGLVVGAVGVDALRYVRRRAQWPLAALPLVLAGHQLVEVPVWQGLAGEVSEAVWRPAAWLYLAIAFTVVPVLVPVAVAALEPPARRRAASALAVVGLAVAVVLAGALVRGPVEAAVAGNRIAYEAPVPFGGTVVGFYVLATCGSLLTSSVPRVRQFGAVNLVVAAGLAYADRVGFISLWCMWAAVSSMAVAAHLRRHAHVDGPLAPAGAVR